MIHDLSVFFELDLYSGNRIKVIETRVLNFLKEKHKNCPNFRQTLWRSISETFPSFQMKFETLLERKLLCPM